MASPVVEPEDNGDTVPPDPNNPEQQSIRAAQARVRWCPTSARSTRKDLTRMRGRVWAREDCIRFNSKSLASLECTLNCKLRD